jgi:hypothetical protein
VDAHFDRFVVERASGCWEWVGGRDQDGYGIYRPPNSKRKYRAHRYVLLVEGVDPEHVCHTCDNPPCVRRDHLFAGDAQVNAADMASKGRVAHNRNGARLTESTVIAIRDRYAAGGISMGDLAAEYGVSKGAIQLAIEHRSWQSVGGYRRPVSGAAGAK